MFNELADFEQELKKVYSCETEFTHSKSIQQYIDYMQLNLLDLCKIIKENITAGPKVAFSPVSVSFGSTVRTIELLVNASNKKMIFVYCEDTRNSPPDTWIISFAKKHETKYIRYLRKIEKLKAFL